MSNARVKLFKTSSKRIYEQFKSRKENRKPKRKSGKEDSYPSGSGKTRSESTAEKNFASRVA